MAVEAEALFAIEAKQRQGTRTDLGSNIPQIVAESDDYPTESRERAGDLLGVNRQYVSDAKKLRETAPNGCISYIHLCPGTTYVGWSCLGIECT